ncbi:hypothetical protein BH11GEM1_BH11GEM1_02550 [soil metagenome]
MANDENVHPDEGTIHAWLDGALDAEQGARLHAHVAGCEACAERVAEARGLVAGASRVVTLLDEPLPQAILPASTRTAGTDMSAWRLMRVTPARAAIAAVLVVAVGITLTRSRVSVDRREFPAASAVSGAAPQDSVLSDAVARRLAAEDAPRTVAAAPGVSVPAPDVERPNAAAVTMGATEARVLAGRASMNAQRDSAGVRADRTKAGVGQLAAGAAIADARVAVAAKAADSAGRPARMLRVRGAATAIAAGECYRVESTAPAAWGSASLPFIVAIDTNGTDARVLTASGGVTETRAFLEANGADSALLRLRRIGYSGSMSLSTDAGARKGVMRSVAESATPLVRGRSDATVGRSTAVTAQRVGCPATR